MKYNLKQFTNVIKVLPLKKKYTKEELLTPDFLIEQQGAVEIYYAPHNEYLNPQAKIFIVGITPGFEQMSRAISEARSCFEENLSWEDVTERYRTNLHIDYDDSMNYGILQFLAYILDSYGFTEHGSSVGGCWLTKEGEKLLTVLDAWHNLEEEIR